MKGLLKILWLTIVVTVIVSGCETNSSIKIKNPSTADIVSQKEEELYLEQADLSSITSETIKQKWRAARRNYKAKKFDKSYYLINDIAANGLTVNQQFERSMMIAAFQRSRGQSVKALAQLDSIEKRRQLNSVTPGMLYLWTRSVVQLHQLNSNYEAAFYTYDLALSLSSAVNKKRYRSGLWRQLKRLSSFPINPYKSTETAGWVALAKIEQHYQLDTGRQYQSYLKWQLQYPNHPAISNPPASIAALNKLVQSKRLNIALLLPLSGNLKMAGSSVLDGFMTARSHSQKPRLSSNFGPSLPKSVQIFDTQTTPMLDIYRQLRERNIDVVIGPLSKEKVAEYVAMQPRIPTLTLNVLPQLDRGQPLLSLPLNIEEEAKETAKKAFEQGHTNAIILVPDNKWGDRAANAFEQEWANQGGNLLGLERYQKENSTHARLIEQSLEVQASKQRKRALQNKLGKVIEFQPRRRQDVDMIFLAASAQQARQLKPMLAFFYAGDVPVYATSSIYNGSKNTKQNRDLNDVYFATQPYILDETSPFRSTIQGQQKPGVTALKMQALGVDSYFLSQRLKEFLSSPDMLYQGVTGWIEKPEIGPNMHPKLQWARFSDGVATAEE